MTTLVGKQVKTFAEASHALPGGMHMNANYPFMLPPITAIKGKHMTIRGSGGEKETVKITRQANGHEVAYIKQSSTFERIYGRPPQRFTLFPFKDDKTPVAPQGDEIDG